MVNPFHSLYYRWFFLHKNAFAHAVTRLFHPAVRSQGEWDEQYRCGEWNRLMATSERPHNAVLLSYVDLRQKPAILEIGCGPGILLPQLKASGYRKYVGVDISSIAIQSCMRHADHITTFLSADAGEYKPDFSPDVMIFNESIYYFPDPAETLRRYLSDLSADGIAVISMVINPKTSAVIRRIRRDFPVLHQTSVTNEYTWMIVVIGKPQ